MQLGPGVKTNLAWGDKLMLSVVALEAGSIVSMHNHPHEQAGIVLEGQFDLTIGGETRRARKGDMYVIPGGGNTPLSRGRGKLSPSTFSTRSARTTRRND